MTKSKSARGDKVTTVVLNDPDDRKGELKTIGGSQSRSLEQAARQSGGAGPLDRELRDRDP